MVQVIKSESEFSTAIKADKLVVVDFFAVWCGPCKMIAPMLEKFSQQYSNVAFYKVDVDELPSVAQSQEVTSMPTLLFFKSGELVGKVIGANPAAIKQTIDKLAWTQKKNGKTKLFFDTLTMFKLLYIQTQWSIYVVYIYIYIYI